jgi:hypothetical protein
MVEVVLPFNLLGWLIAQGWIQVMLIVLDDPAHECPDQCEAAVPSLQPNALVLHSPDDPFGVRLTLRVVKTGAHLLALQRVTYLHRNSSGFRDIAQVRYVSPSTVLKMLWAAATNASDPAVPNCIASFELNGC